MIPTTRGVGTMMRRKRERTRLPPDERRAAIVQAAIRCFEGKDPTTVTFEEIAAAAGVSRALVYNYFGDRGGLLAAVYEALVAELDQELAGAFAVGVTPRERVHEAVERYVAFAGANPTHWQMRCLLEATPYDAVKDARRARFDRLAQVWGSSAESRIVVAGLVGLIEAIAVEWLSQPTLDVARLVELADELAWSGFEHVLGSGVVTGDLIAGG